MGCLRLISQEEGEEDVQSKAEKKEDTASLRLKDDQVPCFETEISRDCALTHHQMTSGFTVKEMWSMEVMHLARRE